MRVLSSSWALLATLASATGAGGGNGIFRASRCLTGSHNCHDDAVCTYATGSNIPQCTCRRGFVGDGFTCSDLDECATYRHDCTLDETCVNTEGGFYCKKRENKDGSRLTLPGQACFDGSNTCHNLATCVPDNNLQGYDCICHEGFYGNGGGLGPGAPGCHDIDECLTVNECNSLGAECVNTFGNYICKDIEDKGQVCENAECDSLAMCVPNHKSNKGYDCLCKDGFDGNGNARMTMDTSRMALLAASGSSRGCKDIDECKTGDNHCFGQTCVNTPGSYFCTVTQDPWAVCADGAHTCHEHAICMPSPAARGYDCVCKAGYEGNGNAVADFWSDQRGSSSIKGCQDVNECQKKSLNNCITQDKVQQCVNVSPEEGGYVCVDLIPSQSCADAGGDALDAQAVCDMDPGKYNCVAYNIIENEGKDNEKTTMKTTCVDIDECQNDADNNCAPAQSCLNKVGSFECIGLADIQDVCSQNPCKDGETCADSGDGYYMCIAPVIPGPCDPPKDCVAENGNQAEFVCIEINQAAKCVNKTAVGGDPYGLCDDYWCGENKSCSIIDDGIFKTRDCSCNNGFELDAVTKECVDFDECGANTDTCDPAAGETCKNIVGGFVCLDAAGLSDWWCALKPGICGSMDVNANCTATEPTPGSPKFTCSCSDGYDQTDATADPTDPAEAHKAQCRDEIDCYPGSTFCGEDFCIEKIGKPAECTNATDPLNVCNGKNPCGVHGDCSVSADRKERVCTCHVGYSYKEAIAGSGVKTCIDDDECELDADFGDDTCSVFQTCVNTPGSYHCDTHPDPFGVCAGSSNPCLKTIGASCSPKSCDGEPDPCIPKATAQCTCEAGFVYNDADPLAPTCDDVDECSNPDLNNCLPSQTCANVPGGFFCVDNDGPCAAGQHECHAKARCVPSYAKRGYDCQCLVGYHGQGEMVKNRTMEEEGIVAMGPNGPKGCVDNDECEGGAHDCHPDETCMNIEGSYTCKLEYDPFGVCDNGAHDCHPLAACTPVFPNGKAEHKCTCRAGYQGSGQVCVNQNECALDMHDCSAHQICVDTDGGYQCIGVADPLGACDTHDCNDLSLCRADPNMEAGYKCVDINECLTSDPALKHDCTINQSCINVNYGAGFICLGQGDPLQVCRVDGPAYRHCLSQQATCELANTFSGYKCVDINECTDVPDICMGQENLNQNRTTCINKNPGYVCVDKDLDEFQVCKKVDCGPNADCAAVMGVAVCTCKPNYTPGIDGNICVDIDECSDPTLNDCVAGVTVCVNVPAEAGEDGWHCDGGEDPHGVCQGSNNKCVAGVADGSVSSCAVKGENMNIRECVCSVGYQHPNDNGVVNLDACEDIDECTDKALHGCQIPEVCENTPGSSTCVVSQDPYGLCVAGGIGYESCKAMGDTAAACNIQPGENHKFTCTCGVGFTNLLVGGPGYETCTDINECDITPSICAAGEKCTNTVGAHTCDNTVDPANDPCTEGHHRCTGDGATACNANMDGVTYTCTCKAGYREIVRFPHAECVEIDECAESDHNCDVANGQVCINKKGNQTVEDLGATDQDPSPGDLVQGFECKWQSLVDPHGVCHGADALQCFVNADCVVYEHDQTQAFCQCPKGWFYDSQRGCTDIDECKFTGLNTCTFTQLCVNTIGSYVCVENDDPFGHCSGGSKCHPLAICTPHHAGNDFMCTCADGYEGDGMITEKRAELDAEEKGKNKNKQKKGCHDIDECLEGKDHCQSIGKFCVNTEGSYECVDEANASHPCGNGQHDCHHLARCEVSPTSKSGYICKCNHGFQGHGRENKRALTGEIVAAGTPRGCSDINECKFGHHNCQLGQFCHNTIGGFKCMGPAQSPTPCEALAGTAQDCGNGMRCVHNDNGSPKCIDVNECIETVDACPYGKTCVNSVGSFSCQSDVAPSDPCDSNPCQDDNLSCVTLGNTFACLDKDECLTENTCKNGEVCYNQPGGYLCIPDPMSVCAAGAHNCHAEAVCIPNSSNKDGFDCVCNSGYYGNGNKGSARMSIDDWARSASGPKGCHDINECDNSSSNNCDDKICVNTPGSYYCTVNPFPGEGDGEKFCQNANQCDITEDCIEDSNAKKGYRCECKTGFHLKNGKCQNIDECAKETHNCAPLQVCWDDFGDFSCLGHPDPLDICKDIDCGSGFDCVAYGNRQGYKCVDVDECIDERPAMKHTCTDGMTCINFAGSYACRPSAGPDSDEVDPCDDHVCRDGTRCVNFGGKAKCSGINECHEKVHPCPWGEICRDTQFDFECIPDLSHVCSQKKSKCGAHSTCVPLGAGKKNYACICDAGYESSGENECEDINECLDPLACGAEEYCINTAGSFVCFDQEVIQNEYETPCDENDCDINAHCVVNYHMENEYECVCNNGYRGDGIARFSQRGLVANGGKTKGCVNVDECDEGTHTCGANQGCVDNSGGFDCKEDPFGVCKEGEHSCNLASVCQPKPGQLWDYECKCREGFEDSCLAKCGTTWSFCYRSCMIEKGKGNYCVDIDECEKNIDDCHMIKVVESDDNVDHLTSLSAGTYSTTCVNTPGNFYCTTLLDPLGLCESWENNDCNNATTTCTIDHTDRLKYTCEPLPGFKLPPVQPGSTEMVVDAVNINECTEVVDNCNGYAVTDYDCPIVNPNDVIGDRCYTNKGGGIYTATSTYCVDHDPSTHPDGKRFECVTADTDPFNVCADNPCGMNPQNGTAFPCTVDPNDAHKFVCDCFPEFSTDPANAVQIAQVNVTDGTCEDFKNCDDAGNFLHGGSPTTAQGVACAAQHFCVENEFAFHECINSTDPYDLCSTVDCGLGVCTPVQPALNTYKCVCPDQVFYDQVPEDLQPGLPTADGSQGKCTDKDECADGSHICDAAADEFCMNEIGTGYNCTVDADPYGVCVDVNKCGPNGVCTLSADRKEAICECRSGFTDICEDACEFSIVPSCYEQCINSLFAQQRCQNINECDKKNPTHTCLTTEECFDIEGSFLCRNQCDLTNPCDPNASCTADYSKDGFTCACNQGYYGDGMNQNPGQSSLPDDIDMSHLVGFGQKKNKVEAGCLDIDECALQIHNCDTDNGELCINTFFNETTGMGYECNAEADPFGACAFNAHDCHPLANCVVDQMADEGYTCECNSGFYGDGHFHFIDINGRKRRSDEDPFGAPYGADEWWTPAPFDPMQRTTNTDVKGCIDIDECHYELDTCPDDETCFNSVGSFYCVADMTTVAPDVEVELVDCFINGIECDKAGICYLDPLATQTNGHNCKCPSGYNGNGVVVKDERGGKNRGCEDINECEDDTHNCVSWQGEFCKNTEGGFECLTNTKCLAGADYPCHANATCITEGQNDFTCECPSGTKGNGKGINGCIDIDECKAGHACHETAECTNLPSGNGYKCFCRHSATYVEPRQACAIPDTGCGNVADWYALQGAIVGECMEGTKNVEICQMHCPDPNHVISQSEVVCQKQGKTANQGSFTDFQGTPITCSPPPETQCGNMVEAFWYQLINVPDVAYECEQVKNKNGIQDICRFKCTGAPSPQTGVALIPSVGYPTGIVVCERLFKKNKKGKPTTELEDQAMWVQDAFGATNNAPIECIDPSVTTVCGDITNAMQIDAGVTVNCENNICTFDCTKHANYPEVVPNHAFSTCGIHVNQTDFTFSPSETISCVTKPDDTECGDIRDHFQMSDDTDFSLGPDGSLIMFECGGGKLAQPPTSTCDKDNKVFGHPLNTPIRCY